MPAFRSGRVVTILSERKGLQRVEVDLGSGPERAYVLDQLTGSVAAGDRVVVNTTAVDLGLGTGGWHFVHWNLERDEWEQPGPGHILKAALHEPPGRRRLHRGAPRRGTRGPHVDRRHARGGGRAPQPTPGRRGHDPRPAARRADRVRHDRRRRAAARVERPRRGPARPIVARRHHHVRPRVRRRLRSGDRLLRAGDRPPRRPRRRRHRGHGPGHRRHRTRASGSPASRWDRSSTRPRGSAVSRSPACARRSPTRANVTRGSPTTRSRP